MIDYAMEHYSGKINKTSNCTKETRHDKLSQKLFKHFIHYLLTLKDDKYKPLQKVVPGVSGKGLVRFIVKCSGSITASKIAIVNDIMCKYVRSLCKIRINTFMDGEYHQPSTTNCMLRQLFSFLVMYHEWEFKINTNFNFNGGLARMVCELYKERCILIKVSCI